MIRRVKGPGKWNAAVQIVTPVFLCSLALGKWEVCIFSDVRLA